MIPEQKLTERHICMLRTKDAVGQIRNAGLDAAKHRQAAAVIGQVGRDISREVGQGKRIRF